MLTSITDSVVPPATDREIEAIVAIAYPGEQNSRVEARLAETLATHPSLSRFLQQASPTFVPRSADTALVISVALVGQGVMDVPDGAEGLNTWVESAFRPDPTDRLAWRQRDGYRDPIDFIDDDARAELLQRLLAAAWNGELTAERRPSNGQTRALRHPHRAVRGAAMRRSCTSASTTCRSRTPRAARRRVPARDLAALRLGHRAVSEILRGLSRTVPAASWSGAGRRATSCGSAPCSSTSSPSSTRRAGRRGARELRHLRDELRRPPPSSRSGSTRSTSTSRSGSGRAGRAHAVVRDAGLRLVRRGDRGDPPGPFRFKPPPSPKAPVMPVVLADLRGSTDSGPGCGPRLSERSVGACIRS